ncbi:hypothetical protein ACMBCM_09480, partial [Spiroplasma sp. K1]
LFVWCFIVRNWQRGGIKRMSELETGPNCLQKSEQLYNSILYIYIYIIILLIKPINLDSCLDSYF